MPNDTSFAVMYKKLVDRNFEPEPQMLKKIRSNLMGQISAQASPVTKEKQIWTKRSDCDKIPSGTRIGEEKK